MKVRKPRGELELQRLEVGPWPMNCYLLRCPETGQVAIVDPGEDADAILSSLPDARLVCCILLTHAHPDHVGALDAVRQATAAPVGIHPADAEMFGIDGDLPLIHAFNFVIDDVLEGGVNGSLNLDGHGKSLSFRLLALTLRVPACHARGPA